MNREQSLQKLKELDAKLNGCPLEDAYDDGSDNCDKVQNMRFATVCRRIKKLGQELAFVKPDSIPFDTLDRLWKEAWGIMKNPHLPEEQYFHHIVYIRLLEQEIKKQQP